MGYGRTFRTPLSISSSPTNSAFGARVLYGSLSLLFVGLAASISGCTRSIDETSEDVGQVKSALCLLGSPCTLQQGDCTGTGTCNSSGQCVVSVWCNDGNPCKSDSCDWNTRLLKYTCTHTNVTNGTSCNDGNACTTSDTCQTGVCTGGAAPNCNDSNACTTDGCNTSTGCTHTTVNCNDSNACTTDGCNTTSGCTHTTVNCNDNNACTTDGCNTTSGCTHTTITCNDNNACTSDTCSTSSGCQYTPIYCEDDYDVCTVDGCNPSTGCTYDPISCDDSNACTDDGCSATAGCSHSAVNCNDNNACTVDGCNTTTGCTHSTLNCNDNSACTTDSCNTSTGCAHVNISCDDGNACTSDGCNAVTGCTHTTVTCNDGSLCTTDTCNTSTGCVYTPVSCDDGNVCTVDGCSAGSGCSHTFASTATGCDDGKYCTRSDHCDGAGHCTGSDNCDDANECTADGCNPDGTCYHTNTVVCTALDQCHDVGTCDPNTGGCTNPPKPNGASCNDNLNCTTGDSCQAGVCTGVAVVCTALDQCHDVGTCNPASGTCSDPVKPNGSSCTDNNPCWVGENCQNGTCAGGSQYTCPEPDQCHNPTTCTVSPATGNPVCDYPNKPDGAGCNDSNLCTQTDTCQSGSCVGSNPAVCTALDQCHFVGTCSSSTGVCSDPEKPNGSGCTDNDECTQSDSCQTGVCVGSNPIVCSPDGNPCTSDACNSQEGTCDYPPEPASHSCDDGNLCTGSDHCDGAGQCAGGPGNTGLGCDDQNACTGPDACTSQGTCSGPEVNKDDSKPCTEDICDPMSGVWHINLSSGTECGDGNPLNGDEICNASVECLEGTMGKPVVAYDETVIERRLGTGRHPVAVSPQRMAVAFVEVMKDTEAAPRIGAATFDHFGVAKGAGRFDASVIDAGPVLAGLPGGGFAMAYAALGEKEGDGLDVVLRTVSADGVIDSAKVVANEIRALGQRAPDIVWAGDHLLVGWEDESTPGIRQVCWRAFSDKLAPLGSSDCDKGNGTASSLTLAASGTEVAKAWRKEGSSLPSVEVELPGGHRSFGLGEASPSGAAALTAVGAHWMVVYTEGCGLQQAAIVDDTGAVLSETPLGTGTPERYEPSLAVTEAGIYLSWREPAQLEGGVWGANLDEVYLQQHTWANNLLTPGAKRTLPAGTALLQGDQSNAAIVAVPTTDDGALFAAWEDWNPNVPGHCKHGDVLISLIVTRVVRP